jgi:PKD repeat protein
MKKLLLTCGLIASSILGLDAQIIKSGNITANETWTSNNIYLLNGWVYVKAGVTVTIQPGTIIKGDFVSKGTLIVERDAKIIADGTVDQPIVFTSQKAVGQRSYGDWGGVILCGRASVNLPANVANGTAQGEGVIEGGVGSLYGGGSTPNDNDSSGVLRYVRIEYPGVAFQPNSEINGLTMGGVGRKTVVEHIQVSYSGDDSYEWFGGTVNCKWLIAYRGWDDDFDTDNGYSGKVQYGVVMRDPNIADQSGSNGFESDNDATGTTNTPITQPVFTNISVFGPLCFNSTVNSLYRRALHLRRNTRTSVFNSVFAGYPTGLLIESSSTQTNATNGDLRFKNTAIAQMNDTLAATTAANPNNVNGAFNIGNPSASTGWFYTGGFANSTINTASMLMVNNLSLTAPELTLSAGSPLLSGASFSDSYLNSSFFTPTTYIGAFDGANDWTDCWAEWDPQNQPYNAALNNAFSATATAQSATTFCQGGSVVLDATTAGAATYAWSNGGTTAQITVTTSGTYSCTVTKSNGCSAVTNAITVTVNPTPTAPTIGANGPTTFCNGDTVILTSSQTSGIVWSNNATTSSITVVSSGSYDVTYTDGNGCSVTSAATTVTVNANPSAPVVTASGSTSFCTGDSVMLSSSQANGNLWSNGATTQDIYVSQSGSYSVTYTDGNGCTATSSATTVSVSSSPAPTVSITGSTQLCPGESVTLSSSTGDTYQWYLNGNPINGATSQTYSANAAGTYAVDVTNSNPCNGAGMSANTVVTVLTAPTAGFTWGVPVVNQYQFTSTSANATIYAWDFGDLSGSSAQNPIHIYTANGTYTVTLIVTGSNGCTDTTTQVINFVSGVEEAAAMGAMTVYPNPANDLVNITFNMNAGADVNVLAYDMTGKVLVNENQDLSSGTTNVQYNTTEWSNGVYFFRVTENGVSNTVRVVIAR